MHRCAVLSLVNIGHQLVLLNGTYDGMSFDDRRGIGKINLFFREESQRSLMGKIIQLVFLIEAYFIDYLRSRTRTVVNIIPPNGHP